MIEGLNKPGKLTGEELAVMRPHARRGHDLLLERGHASAALLDVCLHQHEKLDGIGYPERLTGDAISLLAHRGVVCDVYDAVTSEWPCKADWDPADALRQMAPWKGHFDPADFQDLDQLWAGDAAGV